MEYEIRIYNTIESLGESKWQLLYQKNSLYLSYEWLRSVEGMLTSDTFYVTAWSKHTKKILAGIPCYLVKNHETYSFFNMARLLTEDLGLIDFENVIANEKREQLDEYMKTLSISRDELYPCLICVSPFGYTSSIGINKSEGHQKEELFRAIIDAFNVLSDSYKASNQAFLYVDKPDESSLVQLLKMEGYLEWCMAAECTIPIFWKSFNEYIEHLPKKRRDNVKRELRVFREKGYKIDIVGAESLTKELVPLQAQVHRKYGHRGNYDRIQRGFEQIKKYLGKYVRVFLIRDNSAVLGFALFYEMNDIYYCKQVGFDYAKLDDDFSYFNCAFYKPISEAIFTGKRAISYGIGAYSAKVRRGGQLSPLYGYLKCKSDISDYLSLINPILTLQDEAHHTYYSKFSS